MRTRLQFDSNEALTDSDARHQFLNRAKVNFDFMPMDSMKVRFAPKAYHQWSQTNGDEGAAGTPNNVDVYAHEAWMAYMPSDSLSLFIGRQELSYGKGRVIGARNWSQAGQQFDAARARLSYDMGHTDIFWSKLNDRQFDATRGKDADLFAIYNSLNLEDRMEFVRHLDIYGFYWLEDTTAENKVFNVGARLAGDMMMAFYELEFGGQFGKLGGGDSETGLWADATVGTMLQDRHSVALNFAYANQHYVNLLGDVHEFFGDADLLGRQNLMSIAVKTAFGLTDEFSAELDGYYFMKAKKAEAVVNTLNAAYTTANESALGFEVDARLAYQPAEMLTFELGGALFAPGNAFKDANQDKTALRAYLEGTMKF